jgi:hydrogenase expression/formation protein HypE
LGLDEFTKIIPSIKTTADKAGVNIITGDTKVVERGKGDKIYINTSGFEIVHEKADIKIRKIKENDAVIINSPIAPHGMAIMSEREGLQFESDIVSNTTNLNYIIFNLIEKFGNKIHFFRDATRGGLASVFYMKLLPKAI